MTGSPASNPAAPVVDRRLFAILLIVFVNVTGAGMIIPLLPLFAQDSFDMDPKVITLLFSSFFIAQMIAAPTLGRLSDRFGRLPILLISQIGTAISFVLLGAAQSVIMLFAARILDGITGGNISVAQAYVTDVTPPEKRTISLGYVFASFGLGFIVGPALGGLLASSLGPRLPFYFAAGIALLTFLLTWFTLEESRTDEHRQAHQAAGHPGLKLAAVRRNRALSLVLLVVFAVQLSLGLLQSTFALVGEAVWFTALEPNRVALAVGILLMVVGVAQFLTQSLVLRPLLKRFHERRLVVAGAAAMFGGMLFYAFAQTAQAAAFGAILFPFGLGISMPSLQSLATHTVPPEQRGEVIGVYQSAASLAIIIGTAIGGTLFEISPAAPYWVGSGLAVGALILAIVQHTD